MSSDYLELFRSEAREHINHIQQLLLDLEEQPDPDIHKELLQILHTLKGDANLVNKKHVANLAHGLEDTIKEVQAGRLKLRKSGFVLISQKVDLLSEHSEYEEDPEDADEVIKESLLQLQQLAQGILATTRMFVRPSVEELYAPGQIPEVKQPLITPLTDENIKIAEPASEKIEPASEKIEPASEKIEIPFTNTTENQMTGEESSSSTLLLPHLTVIGEDQKVKSDDGKDTKPHPLFPPSTSNLKKPRTDSKLYHAGASQESLRIPMKKIDDLIDLMGEIAIIKDKVENKLYQSYRILDDFRRFYQLQIPELDSVIGRYNDFYDEFSQDVTELELVTNDLKVQSIDVKMVPLSTILTDSYTLVRNKSLELQKNVAPLQVTGGETKVDKSLLESLRKMLIHLLLNALAHGFEDEEERAKQGKPTAGTLKIRALTKSDTIIIEVEDDGKGLNAEDLKQKALDKGLIQQEEANGMNDKDAFYLITQPGFSTAEKITQDSGRGVGMDVVYSTIHKLKGSLIIESELHKFTRISMVFPVNLSIINSFLILVEEQVLAIPLNYVKETYIASREELRMEGGLTILKREERGDIPVISLAQYLQYPESEDYQEQFHLLILDYQNEELAIKVSRFLRIQEIIVKPLSGALKDHKVLSGATILRTGEPAVIINIANIFRERKKWYKLRLALEKSKQNVAHCLIVDNSEMSLMVLDSILREADYITTLASSIKMAQDRYLQEQKPMDLVVLNVTLDFKDTGGFELLRWMRMRNPTQKIVLISNSSSKEITRLSYQQGANLYFCKLGFQTYHFLEKVRHLLESSDD